MDPEMMNDASVVICGEAGQGIQTVEDLLSRILKAAGYHVFASKEYMSRIRGGSNSTEIRVSSRRVAAFVDRIDLLLPLGKGAVDWVAERISPRTVILGDRESLGGELDRHRAAVTDFPLGRMAEEIGGRIYGTTIAAGTVAALFGVELLLLEDHLRRRFGGKSPDVLAKNIEAARKGYAAGAGLAESGALRFTIGKDPEVRREIILSGGEAVGLGAVAGGCNFIASYPMSPSTPVLVFLARHAREFGIVVEQAEDEIAAVNMGLGAWYAGARAMVTTSGGGFALMTEGLSLAGMHESPLVIHLAQRPGPATGLPTRTEQADLLHALHAGHGEFPRIILAPGTLEEAFSLTRRAFNLAAAYQVPVFILTDQQMVDSYYNLPLFDPSGLPEEKGIVRTGPDYRRYRITGSGISPRGIPGFGEGLVVAGSDEHDEEGHITEDKKIRRAMVEKRLRKGDQLFEAAVPPEFTGGENRLYDREYPNLIIGWGSTRQVIGEAVASLGREDLEFLHFSQVWPVHPGVLTILERARKVIFIENNATGQFARTLKTATGWRPRKNFHGVIPSGGPGEQTEHLILKYDGSPFSVEEVVERVREITV